MVQTFFNASRWSKGSSNLFANVSVFINSFEESSLANICLWWAGDLISSGLFFPSDCSELYLWAYPKWSSTLKYIKRKKKKQIMMYKIINIYTPFCLNTGNEVGLLNTFSLTLLEGTLCIENDDGK